MPACADNSILDIDWNYRAHAAHSQRQSLHPVLKMRGVILEIASNYARLGLRVLFNGLLLLLGLAGDQCCRKDAQLQTILRKPLDLSHYTGWLHGSTAAIATFKMRRFPGGWLGIVMILAGLLWTAADLAVSGLVVTVQVVDRCWFNTTGFYETIFATPFNYTHVPPNVGNLYNLVTRAQATSQVNGGLGGIYAKVNNDLTFRADPRDVVGYWNCQDVGQDETYSVMDNETIICNDLEAKNLLFYNWSSVWDQYPDGPHAHLVAWSSSIEDGSALQPWDVRVSIDMTPRNIDDKVMKSYLCIMNAAAVDWVLRQTPSRLTLDLWIPNVKAQMYENSLWVPPVPNPAEVIESILDAIIMISGASASGPNISTSPVIDPTQGCLASKALVPWPVVLLLILVITGTTSMIIYWVCLICVIQYKQTNAPQQRVLLKSIPNGLLGWIVQAVHETGVVQGVKNEHLNEWFLVPVQNRSIVCLRRGSEIQAEDQYLRA